MLPTKAENPFLGQALTRLRGFEPRAIGPVRALRCLTSYWQVNTARIRFAAVSRVEAIRDLGSTTYVQSAKTG